MICHHYKCVFIHIPKNAGQSVEHVFLNLLNLNWETRAPLLLRNNDRPELGPQSLAHLKAEEYVRFKYLTQEMFDNYFKFAFVRNPWSRMVSIYKYLGFNKKYDFKKFLLEEFNSRAFRNKYWIVVVPQNEFLYADDGNLLVDYVGKFESLQNDFDIVCKKIGLPSTLLPHVNESKDSFVSLSLNPKNVARNLLASIRAKNIPCYGKYQDYYDDESINFVAKLYKKDIELFEYDFE